MKYLLRGYIKKNDCGEPVYKLKLVLHKDLCVLELHDLRNKLTQSGYNNSFLEFNIDLNMHDNFEINVEVVRATKKELSIISGDKRINFFINKNDVELLEKCENKGIIDPIKKDYSEEQNDYNFKFN